MSISTMDTARFDGWAESEGELQSERLLDSSVISDKASAVILRSPMFHAGYHAGFQRWTP